jgi:hypothetical protein
MTRGDFVRSYRLDDFRFNPSDAFGFEFLRDPSCNNIHRNVSTEQQNQCRKRNRLLTESAPFQRQRTQYQFTAAWDFNLVPDSWSVRRLAE